jgi:hypothetical protein
MSKLGDVVFCVDCDRARAPYVASGAPALDAPARRMATKRDANGDPLCAACLDARHESRHAEFMQHEGRTPIPDDPETQASLAAESMARMPSRSAYIRIVRSRPGANGATPRQHTTSESQQTGSHPAGSHSDAASRAPRPISRSVERKFTMLVVDIGFLRARQLLDELKARAHKVTGRGSR